jgi:hypothetical protein
MTEMNVIDFASAQALGPGWVSVCVRRLVRSSHHHRLESPEANGAPVVKVLRRVLTAVTIAAAVAAALRVRGKGGTPPQHGGWRQLELPPERR